MNLIQLMKSIFWDFQLYHDESGNLFMIQNGDYEKFRSGKLAGRPLIMLGVAVLKLVTNIGTSFLYSFSVSVITKGTAVMKLQRSFHLERAVDKDGWERNDELTQYLTDVRRKIVEGEILGWN